MYNPLTLEVETYKYDEDKDFTFVKNLTFAHQINYAKGKKGGKKLSWFRVGQEETDSFGSL